MYYYFTVIAESEPKLHDHVSPDLSLHMQHDMECCNALQNNQSAASDAQIMIDGVHRQVTQLY